MHCTDKGGAAVDAAVAAAAMIVAAAAHNTNATRPQLPAATDYYQRSHDVVAQTMSKKLIL